MVQEVHIQEQGRKHRELMARKSREASASMREIAPLPAIKNPQRRISSRKNLQLFCEQYFPKTFPLAWSSYHIKVINRLEEIYLTGGGKFALAMPRGSGKTTLCITSVIWALLYGHSRFIVLVGANKTEANKLIKSIKTSLTTNKTLLDDFPESVYPFYKLNGSALLARGQLYLNEITNIEWKPDRVTFATIPGALSSGATLFTSGISGNIRGAQKNMPDGSIARPDTIVLDDPQSDAVAKSPGQVIKHRDIIDNTIGGLVGPGEELAMLMPCTVIADGDVADTYLNPKIYAQWHGMKFKMVEQMPTNMQLWNEYAEIRKTDDIAANMFYKKNRTAMKEGAIVAWEANFVTVREYDALHHAMNIWADNYGTFMAEYQNEPLRPDTSIVVQPAKVIRSRLNGHSQRVIPPEYQHLTGFIDIHDDLLYYAAVAWAEDFTGYVVDYGTFPEQNKKYFAKCERNLETLQNLFPKERTNAAIQNGLQQLITNLLGLHWEIEGDDDGTQEVWFSKILIDAGYQPKEVENAIRITRSNILQPSLGKGIKSSGQPMSEWRRKANRRFGTYWMEDKPQGRTLRHITFDANYWKVQVHSAFSLASGSRGGITLWGTETERHRMFADHLTAEIAKLVKTNENEVNEWQAIVGKDNHLFDCIVGNFVAASYLGIMTDQERSQQKKRRKIQIA
jgi:hypothetical protein